MKTLIYQYWNGPIRRSAEYGSECMKKYADAIGADYIFDRDSSSFLHADVGKMNPYYGCFRPVYDNDFLKYDYVMFADTDVFPVDGLEESIFDGFEGDVGMADEPLQLQYRYDPTLNQQCTRATEQAWGDIARNKFGSNPPTIDGKFQVLNSGVVVYSREGLLKCFQRFVPFDQYVNAINQNPMLRNKVYATDQGYLHTMLFASDFKFQLLDNEWNRYITWDPYTKPGLQHKAVDPKTKDTKMVHVQLRGADNMSDEWHHTVVNKPKAEWDLVDSKGLRIV